MFANMLLLIKQHHIDRMCFSYLAITVSSSTDDVIKTSSISWISSNRLSYQFKVWFNSVCHYHSIWQICE